MAVAYGAVTCGWPGGCLARTKDTSGLCHHHRRFSGSIWNDDGKMVRHGRLFSTIKLSSTDSETYEKMISLSRKSMEEQPRMVVHPNANNAAILTNINDDRFPLNDRLVNLPYEDDQFAIFPNGDTGDIIVAVKDEDNAQDRLLEIKKGLEQVKAFRHAPRYGLFDGVAEEYDDPSEALAQLDLGSMSDSELVLMNPADDDEEVFRINPDDITLPSVAGVIKPVFPTISETGQVETQYRVESVTTSDNNKPSPDQESVILSMIGVRNIIEDRGIRNPEDGKLYLPRGWTDI